MKDDCWKTGITKKGGIDDWVAGGRRSEGGNFLVRCVGRSNHAPNSNGFSNKYYPILMCASLLCPSVSEEFHIALVETAERRYRRII